MSGAVWHLGVHARAHFSALTPLLVTLAVALLVWLLSSVDGGLGPAGAWMFSAGLIGAMSSGPLVAGPDGAGRERVGMPALPLSARRRALSEGLAFWLGALVGICGLGALGAALAPRIDAVWPEAWTALDWSGAVWTALGWSVAVLAGAVAARLRLLARSRTPWRGLVELNGLILLPSLGLALGLTLLVSVAMSLTTWIQGDAPLSEALETAGDFGMITPFLILVVFFLMPMGVRRVSEPFDNRRYALAWRTLPIARGALIRSFAAYSVTVHLLAAAAALAWGLAQQGAVDPKLAPAGFAIAGILLALTPLSSAVWTADFLVPGASGRRGQPLFALGVVGGAMTLVVDWRLQGAAPLFEHALVWYLICGVAALVGAGLSVQALRGR